MCVWVCVCDGIYVALNTFKINAIRDDDFILLYSYSINVLLYKILLVATFHHFIQSSTHPKPK